MVAIMTNNEITQASSALMAWFISQDIKPKDAGIIMISLIAQLLTSKTKDILELTDAVKDTNNLLVFEIATCLRR